MVTAGDGLFMYYGDITACWAAGQGLGESALQL